MIWTPLVLALACSNSKDDTAGGDSDADTDTDTDSDTDSDTDTDTDTDAFSAEVQYTWTVDGVDICDTLVEVTGTESTGSCPDCDWAFDVTGVAASEGGNISCWRHPALALGMVNPTGFFVSPLTFGHRVAGSGADILLAGLTIQYYEDGKYYTDRPEPFNLAGMPISYGTFGRVGDEVTWTWDYAREDLFRYSEDSIEAQMCTWSTFYSTATEPYDATESDTSTLPCADSDYVDVWSFRGQAGSTAFVTVDALDDTDPMDPEAWIYGPNYCVEVYANDNFECSAGGAACPSMSLVTEDAEYWVVVHNERFGGGGGPGDTGDTGDWGGDTGGRDTGREDSGIVVEPGGCKGKTVSYQIGVDATWTTGLALRSDDISQYGAGSVHVEGTAHLPKGTP